MFETGGSILLGWITNIPVSYTHLDVYKRQEGGTILPVAVGKAKIIVRYDNPSGGYAENSLFEFNVKKAVNALSSVSIEGTAKPGQELVAKATGASTRCV